MFHRVREFPRLDPITQAEAFAIRVARGDSRRLGIGDWPVGGAQIPRSDEQQQNRGSEERNDRSCSWSDAWCRRGLFPDPLEEAGLESRPVEVWAFVRFELVRQTL